MIDSFLFAGLASVCFGVAIALTKFGLQDMHPMAGALVSIPTATVLFWCFAPMMLEKVDWVLPALGIFAVVGLFYPAMVTLLVYEANLRMGPTVAATISSITPLFAIIGAILFLKETLTPLIFLGTAGIVAGLMLISWNRTNHRQAWPKIAVLFPLGAAIIRGGAQTLAKMGLEMQPTPYVAGLIGYTTSVVSILLVSHIRFGLGHMAFTRRGIGWFMSVGIANGSAVLLLYMALKTGNVVTVAPLAATFPIFTLLFSLLFFRHENITFRTIGGVALVVGGVALVSFN